MFDRSIKTETIPERVFELCKMISKGDIKDSVARERMEPKGINTSNTSYYPSIREVLVDPKDLGLVEKDKDEVLRFIGDKKILKNLETFRIYCNSVAFKNADSYFYRITQCFLESDEKWLKYKTLTDSVLRSEIRDATGIPLVDEKMMLGSRFWISFLGFGYIQEGYAMYFLPNMYIALQDYCELSELEKNKEYTVKEFLEIISKYAAVALSRAEEKRAFNLAMSTALREMHDNKEIIIKNYLDSKERWSLYKDDSHEFTEQFTHITYKGVKRR